MKIEILQGCIACGACETINAEVFFLNAVAHIQEENIIGNEDDCYTAAELCPVNVIKISLEL
ncbi:MAG: ferredoxin [bacterium]